MSNYIIIISYKPVLKRTYLVKTIINKQHTDILYNSKYLIFKFKIFSIIMLINLLIDIANLASTFLIKLKK